MKTGHRTLLAAALSAMLAIGSIAPAVADFDGAAGGAQGTWRGDGVGPVTPGLAWMEVLPALEYDGSHGQGGVQGYGRPAVLDDAGHVLIMAKDSNTGTDQLVAVDTTTGDHAWTVDHVSNNCAPVIGPDGLIWAVREEVLGNDVDDVVSINPATGVATSRFHKTAASAADPAFTGCDLNYDAPLRLSPDGSHLYVWEHTYGVPSDSWVRSLDISTPGAVTQDWVLRLTPTRAQGTYGGWVEDMRVAPAGSPAAGTLYLFERTRGASDTGVGQDDVNWVHAIDPGTATTGNVGAAIRDSVRLDATQIWTGAITLVGRALFLSLEEDHHGRVPADGDQVNARNFKVVDDGTSLDIVATSLGRTSAAREPGDHVWHFDRLTAGDDDTLVGTWRAGRGVVGMDADTLRPVWSQVDQGCFSPSIVADAAGSTYLPCVETVSSRDAIGSVTVDGRLQWGLDTDAIHPVLGGGSVNLAHFESFTMLAVTEDGRVLVTSETTSAAPTQGVGVFAIDLGTGTERAAGASRYDTAVDISMSVFPAGADTVVIAKGGDYPDALSGAPLAVDEGGPLLLSESHVLSAVTEAEVRRLGASKAILMGGEVALSGAVASRLTDLGLAVERIEGTTRFDTARLVKERIGATRAVIVEGSNPSPTRGWPDAVAASGWAASTGRAILLVHRDAVPAETQAALAGITDAVVVGGEVAVSSAVQGTVDGIAGTVSRIAGGTRYETSVRVAERSMADGTSLDLLWLATGTGFADALTAGPAAAFTHGVLLLVDGANPAGSPEVYDFLRSHRADVGAVRLVGGTTALSAEVAAEVADALAR